VEIVTIPLSGLVLNCWVTDTKEAPWASSTYDFGEIGSEPLPGLDIGEEPLHRRPLHGCRRRDRRYRCAS
jgi:hypothetical protein